MQKNKPFEGPKLSLPIPKIPSILVIDKFKLNSEVQLRAQQLLDDDGMKLEELCTKLAITYLFRTATDEAKEFVKADTLSKISTEFSNILFCKKPVIGIHGIQSCFWNGNGGFRSSVH